MTMERLEHLIGLAVSADCFEKEIISTFCGDYYFPYYSLFALLGSSVDGGIAVELGVDKGVGSLSLAMGGLKVFGVEQNDKECFNLQANPSLEFLKCSSTPVPKQIVEAGEISVLHLDTEHSYSQVNAEFEAYKPYLADGAVVCFDDTNAMEGEVLRYVRELPYERIEDDRLHPVCGYAVIIYRKGI